VLLDYWLAFTQPAPPVPVAGGGFPKRVMRGHSVVCWRLNIDGADGAVMAREPVLAYTLVTSGRPFIHDPDELALLLDEISLEGEL
jgi:hypothetical protein